jgi:hypothetical protein
MHAKTQAHGVDLTGQRRKALAARAGGKAVGGGQQAAMAIHRGHGLGVVIIAGGAGIIPLDVDGQNVIAGGQQIARHDPRIFQSLRLGDGGGEAVPTVPAHGRLWGQRAARGAGVAFTAVAAMPVATLLASSDRRETFTAPPAS